jgi:hypothetical protein
MNTRDRQFTNSLCVQVELQLWYNISTPTKEMCKCFLDFLLTMFSGLRLVAVSGHSQRFEKHRALDETGQMAETFDFSLYQIEQ